MKKCKSYTKKTKLHCGGGSQNTTRLRFQVTPGRFSPMPSTVRPESDNGSIHLQPSPSLDNKEGSASTKPMTGDIEEDKGKV